MNKNSRCDCVEPWACRYGLTNCGDTPNHELDDASQVMSRQVLDDLDNAFMEANFAVRPVVATTVSMAMAPASVTTTAAQPAGYAYNLADLQAGGVKAASWEAEQALETERTAFGDRVTYR